MSIFSDNNDNSIFKEIKNSKKRENNSNSIFRRSDTSPDVFSNHKPGDIFGDDNLRENNSIFVSTPSLVRPGYKSNTSSESTYKFTLDSEQQKLSELFKAEFKQFKDSFNSIMDNIKDEGLKKETVSVLIKNLEDNHKIAMENTEILDKYIKLSISNRKKSDLSGTGLDYQFGFLISKGSSLNIKNPDMLFLKNQTSEVRKKKIVTILSLIMNGTPNSPYSEKWETLKSKIVKPGDSNNSTKYLLKNWDDSLNSIKYWSFYAYLLSLFDKGTLNLGDLEKDVNTNIMAHGSGEPPKKKEENKKDKKSDKKKSGGAKDKKNEKKKEKKTPYIKERNLRYFIDNYEERGFSDISEKLLSLITDNKLLYHGNKQMNNKTDYMENFNELLNDSLVDAINYNDLKNKICPTKTSFHEYVIEENVKQQSESERYFNDVFYGTDDKDRKWIENLLKKREEGNDLEGIKNEIEKQCSDPSRKKKNDHNEKIFIKANTLYQYFNKYSIYRFNLFNESGIFKTINTRVMTGIKTYFFTLGQESKEFAEKLKSNYNIQTKKQETDEKRSNANKNSKINDSRKKNRDNKLKKLREGLSEFKDKISTTKDEKKKKKLEAFRNKLLKQYKKISDN